MARIEEKESEEYAEEDEEENDREKESSEVNCTALHPNSFFFQTSCSSSPTQSGWVGIGGAGEASAEAEKEMAKVVVEREHMFDKVVTPSDVGKLNRLVIPKQHAEKYFPLDTTTASGEKGLLLNFEDAGGKQWRFRYSYWNSSQSYVMTKGWSRFVKDKKLDAGDVVSFERGATEAYRHRFFIDWKRRPGLQHSQFLNTHHRSVPWGRLFFPPIPTYTAYAGGAVYNLRPPSPPPPPLLIYESVPLINHRAAVAAGKRVRLFGVNLDCPEEQQSQHYHQQQYHDLGYTTGATVHLPPVLQLQLYNGGGEAPSSSAEEVPSKQKQSLSLDLGI